MTICTRVGNYWQTHEWNIKNNLNKLNKWDNMAILFAESMLRPTLWIARVVKCGRATIGLGLSLPLSILHVKDTTSLDIAWNRFCQEARMLIADTFEYIGVVVCAILLLPFNRNNAYRLTNMQKWIETTAEWISGENIIIDDIGKITDPATKSTSTFAGIARKANLTQQQKESVSRTLMDCNANIWSLNKVADTRRIARNYGSLNRLKSEIEKDLNTLKTMIPDHQLALAIKEKQQDVDHLKHLSGVPVESESKFASMVITTEMVIKEFNSLVAERRKFIDLLHRRDDPLNEIGNQITNLEQEIAQGLQQVYDDMTSANAASIHLKIPLPKHLTEKNMSLEVGVGLGTLNERIREHFSEVSNCTGTIRSTYQYSRNPSIQSPIVTTDEPHPIETADANFSSYLKRMIDKCHTLLKVCISSWYTIETTTANSPNQPKSRTEAFQNLGLREDATKEEIREAFIRLSLETHPDKGIYEDGARFEKICLSYRSLRG